MNRTVVAALFEDAYRQVLDDKVFRLLVILALLLILPTFLVAITPDGISALFGWFTWSFSELGVRNAGPETHIQWIQGVQVTVVNYIAGQVGLLFCIAATAFFVPRMLEKGAADTLFSKPVGRFALLLARFSAGVIFVACLSFLLVLGMHIGFRVASGYSDPAFLWSALTLTYTFTLLHSVSVLIAVFTRSSIAAILTTLLFFVFTGCTHRQWIDLEHKETVAAEARAIGAEDAEPESSFGFLVASLNVLHWSLPKTTDADFVVAGARRSLTERAPLLSDTNGLLSVVSHPAGFERTGDAEVDLGATSALWIARDRDGEETARIALSRRSREDPERPDRLRSPSSFAAEFTREIDKDPTTASKSERDSLNVRGTPTFTSVRWRVRGTSTDVDRTRAFGVVEEALYVLDAAFEPAYGTVQDREQALRNFLAEMRVERKRAVNMGTEQWYAQQFGWASPLRYNAFVSIGTSILFVIAMLLLARWRLARIDF